MPQPAAHQIQAVVRRPSRGTQYYVDTSVADSIRSRANILLLWDRQGRTTEGFYEFDQAGDTLHYRRNVAFRQPKPLGVDWLKLNNQFRGDSIVADVYKDPATAGSRRAGRVYKLFVSLGRVNSSRTNYYQWNIGLASVMRSLYFFNARGYPDSIIIERTGEPTIT